MKRFWDKVDTTGECWNWKAGCMRNGYGSFKLNYRTVYAHRLSYEMARGPIPDGMWVRHKCDNPACVNPAHLSIGTPAANVADRVKRQRTVVGTAKIARDDALAIRESDADVASLAAQYELSKTHVRDIRAGKYWS